MNLDELEIDETPNPRNNHDSVEVEDYLIGCCLSCEDSRIMKICDQYQLEPLHFENFRNRVIYDVIRIVHAGGNATGSIVILDALRSMTGDMLSFKCPPALRSRPLMETVTMDYFLTVTGIVDSLTPAEQYVQLVIERHSRKSISHTCSLLEGSNLPVSRQIEMLQHVIDKASKGKRVGYQKARKFSQFEYPAANDESCLLGNDFLNRGATMMLVSYAGQGKSSLVFDMAVYWALGKPFAGIRTHRKMRILIIQAEDDDRYMGKLSESARQVMNLNDDEIRELDENILFVRDKVNLGDKFFPMLEHYIQQHKPDLVIPNPLYLYAGGDITQNEIAINFFAGLAKANPDDHCAFLLVHHTGKPAQKDKTGKRPGTEDWETMYQGFGSSVFANYVRSSMMLEPAKRPGQFVLRLGKGGNNAGVSEYVKATNGAYSVPVPTTRIQLKYSDQEIEVAGKTHRATFWEVASKEEYAETSEELKARPNAGTKNKYDSRRYLDLFPSDRPMAFTQLHRLAVNIDGISKSAFSAKVKDLLELGEIRLHPGGQGYTRSLSH